MTERTGRMLVVGGVGFIAAIVASLAVSSDVGHLVALGAIIAVGECLELKIGTRRGLPLSNALVLVLVAVATVSEAAITVAAAIVIAAALELRTPWRTRMAYLAHRLLVAAGALAAYQIVFESVSEETLTALILALGAATTAELVVEESIRLANRNRSSLGERGRLAWLALASSGMLMAVGYRGVDGQGEFGLWAILVFGVPLLATWYAFEQFESAVRTHGQTIDVLSTAPELGGLVRPGHAERVADLADEMALGLALSESERECLGTAAKLHHLGVVTLDEPTDGTHAHSPDFVAEVTAEMLGEIGRLEPAARIVAGAARANRQTPGADIPPTASMILKVASAFDDLNEGIDERASAALEVLYGAPSYIYDSAVLLALERTLDQRGHLAAAGATTRTG